MIVVLCSTISVPMTSFITINLPRPSFSSSHKHKHLSYKQIKYPKFSFFQMISDLNFDPSDEENYNAEESSGSSFFAGIFPNYGQSNSYPNRFKIQYLIVIKADIIQTILMIVVFIHIRIHMFTNNRTQQCHHVISIIFLEVVVVLMINQNFKIITVI
jgi:hypothetical protein